MITTMIETKKKKNILSAVAQCSIPPEEILQICSIYQNLFDAYWQMGALQLAEEVVNAN